MRIGMDRVRKANAQRVRREYEAIAFKDGEGVDDFAMRLNGLVSQLATLGDPEPANKVVEKYLRVASSRFYQLVLSIETLLDVSTLSVEDITGRLKMAENKPAEITKASDSGEKLYLTAEEWMTTPVCLREARKRRTTDLLDNALEHNLTATVAAVPRSARGRSRRSASSATASGGHRTRTPLMRALIPNVRTDQTHAK
uniref:Uncharacterized protein n=1 Tax=Oryza brachyantha TaxID=4533 RepID=J3NB24_ORYBR